MGGSVKCCPHLMLMTEDAVSIEIGQFLFDQLGTLLVESPWSSPVFGQTAQKGWGSVDESLPCSVSTTKPCKEVTPGSSCLTAIIERFD